jgi:CRISPR-associated protein Csx17
LFKLLFLPRGLVNMAGEQDKPRWRLAGQDDEHPVRIRPEPRILTLLRAERAREAAKIAMRRLWVSGLSLWCSHASHNRQCQIVRSLWASGKLAEHLVFNRGDGRRLAAALLIPISHQSVGLIAQQATSLKLWTDATS